MSARITAAARTPWAPRHGALAHVKPEELLALALDAAASQRHLDPRTVQRVLVACDTGVGAQALNIARRAVIELGWPDVAAFTIDGSGVGDFAAIEVAAQMPGVTLVGAVDVTSTVPPGAGLVRDYGRPVQDEPEVVWLERLAREAGLDRAQLDEAAHRLTVNSTGTRTELTVVRSGATVVAGDIGTDARLLPDDLAPLAGAGGLVTARHEAALADGAAAVVVETGAPTSNAGRRLEHCAVTAGLQATLVDRLRIALTVGQHALADPSVVVQELVADGPGVDVGSVLSVGSAPSGDGLRMLVDVFHSISGACGVVRRGGHGQIGHVRLGPIEPAVS